MAVDDLHAEIRELKAEISRLKARAIEDKRHADKHLEVEVQKAKSTDVCSLEEQIAELQSTVAEEDAIIDRICVYLRKRNSEED